jgi:hypothetical protein
MKGKKMSKIKSQYDANFTAGGLLFNEFKALENLLVSDNFENLIKIEEEQNNIIGIATNSSRKRIVSEIKRRYKIAPAGFWDHFYNWSEDEQKLALFYLCLKTYPLIMDVHLDVALKKYRIGAKLDAYDIQMRFEEIMSYDEEVSNWSELTFKKLNVQYRKALRDSGLYQVNKVLKKPSKPGNQFWGYFKEINEHWFIEACFMDKN